mmetsp:Transcript_24443/g.37723  ORF Transcript_24443/g.37723 Transcript_24443/m.37723 type:complete len:202 (-) Transcript_24443:226-831(-)
MCREQRASMCVSNKSSVPKRSTICSGSFKMLLTEDLRCLDEKNYASDGSETHRSSEVPVISKPPQSLHVSFDFVQVREYERSLGDSPCVSTGGPPIGIGWTFVEGSKIPCKDFENCRDGKRKRDNALILGRREREELLRYAGFSRREMDTATRVASRIMHQRQESNLKKKDNEYELGKLLKAFGKNAKRLFTNTTVHSVSK